MPAVSRLSLTDFRNHRDALIEAGDGFVLLSGPNGAGKTNVLEAVSLLTPGRGLRQVSIADMARSAALAAIGEDGQPVFPAGEPYSLSERMIYESGATRSESGEELLVACPKCGLVRSAAIDTCGNCGLSFTITPPTRTIRPAAPPPGGRAAV